ncbi:MAG: hypothetical protein WAM97_16540 [Acidimicrobiales bacterium]
MDVSPAPDCLVEQTESVRKQYHFWPADSGFDAWDVDRLIEMTRDLPVSDVEVSTIEEIDSVYWFDEAPQPTVRAIVNHIRLVNEADTSFPVILSVEGRVMDGMHRIAKAMLEGHATIRAVMFTKSVEPDYRNCRPQDLPY